MVIVRHVLFGPWFGAWFQLLMVLLFFVIIWWMLKGGHESKYAVTRGGSAEEILKRRYVTGEITKKQFEVMKKDIGA